MSDYKITRDDKLCHWKYTKREKVNGKWVYTYPDGSRSAKVSDRVKDALGYDEKARLGEAVRKYNRASENADNYDKLPGIPNQRQWYDSETSKRKHKEAVDAGEVMVKRYKEYYKTPIGKLDKLDDAIDKGRNILASMLEGAAKKVRAREEYHTSY